MNRQQRRAAQAQSRQAMTRAEVIQAAVGYLAEVAGPSATGATVIMPDGEMLYLSADDARARPRGNGGDQ